MQSDVVVVGGAIVPFARRSEGTIDELGARAVLDALDTTGISSEAVQEIYCSTVFGGSLIGQRSMRFAGLSGRPTFNVENACASGGVAIHLAVRAISAGAIDCALVLGVEKLSSIGTGALPLQPTEWEAAVGATMPAVYAMRARRYMHEFKVSQEDLAAVAVKSHRFSAINPDAHLRDEWTLDDVLGSRMIADPLTLFQCSPKSDGSAAVLLTSPRFADSYGLDSTVRITSTVVTTGKFSMSERDILKPDISIRAIAQARREAEFTPDELDVCEVHDAFTIAELMYYEALGLCEPGNAVDLLHSGQTSSLDPGAIPVVNPSGGLLGRGHPVGATGVAQILECSWHLSGQAGRRQRAEARTALAHVTGGGISGFDNGACSVTVLRRAA